MSRPGLAMSNRQLGLAGHYDSVHACVSSGLVPLQHQTLMALETHLDSHLVSPAVGMLFVRMAFVRSFYFFKV